MDGPRQQWRILLHKFQRSVSVCWYRASLLFLESLLYTSHRRMHIRIRYPQESGTVTETTPITDTTPRTERLLQAEKFCLEAGGCALRLAGLYLLERGAHSFYMKSTPEKPIQGNPSGLVNLLHYDDAAGACLAALLAGPGVCRNQIFLICDGALQTRQQICESTLQSAAYRDCTMPTFASEPDPANPGKQLDGTFSNQALQWSPRYKSFDEFMKDNA
jgi:nucleoside-diphosphate-sugar epimerase